MLANYQTDVLMTRTSDTTVSLANRTSLANSRNADYFCSIHINAGGGTGWESYIYNGTVSQKTIDARNTLHNTVMSAIGGKYGVRDRGKKRANFHVLRETAMPAVLLENLFIDHSSDLNLLNSATFINDLSKAIGKVLYKVIAGSFKDVRNAEERKNFLASKGIDSVIVEAVVSGEKWYRVQAGAFQSKASAEARLKEVKEAGISDAYILTE